MRKTSSFNSALMEMIEKQRNEPAEKESKLAELTSQLIGTLIDTYLTIINTEDTKETPPTTHSSLKRSLDDHFKHETERAEKEKEVKLAREACQMAKELYLRSAERLEVAVEEYATTIEYEKRLEAAANAFIRTMEAPTNVNQSTNSCCGILRGRRWEEGSCCH